MYTCICDKVAGRITISYKVGKGQECTHVFVMSYKEIQGSSQPSAILHVVMLYQAPPSPSNGQKRDRILSRSLPLRQPIGRQDGGSVQLRQPIGTQDGWGRAANQYM